MFTGMLGSPTINPSFFQLLVNVSCVDDEFEALDLGGMKFDVESGRLAELNQYREMMLAIGRHVRGTDAVEVLYSFRNLSIGHYVGFADE